MSKSATVNYKRKSRLIDVGRAALTMTVTTYADTFWGGGLSSTIGYDALVKRNSEGKKICAELEDYLKRRSKLEADYSKSLSNLARTCFKDRDQIGVLEATLNKLRSELDVMAAAHSKASDFFSQHADAVERFKKDQNNNRKGVEEALAKSQNSKITQLSKTKQLEKTYVKRCLDKDSSEASYREIITTVGALPKDIDKARGKAFKAEDEANKADTTYQSAVLVLDSCRKSWEDEMVAACNAIQQLDEERILFLRQELWDAINADSQIALDVDNSCEQVREILEKCDVISDIDAFISARATGTERPEPFVYRHYTKITPAADNDSNGSSQNDATPDESPYASVESPNGTDVSSPPGKTKKHFTFAKPKFGLKK